MLCELETAQAKIRDLQQRLFARKSERGSLIDDKQRRASGVTATRTAAGARVMVVRGRRLARTEDIELDRAVPGLR
ncbi:MAG: hypothetical protein IPI02_14765 [Sterolibacteriaceae bacterium]|nr:hypothetical protein [Sterolibacteriaceae bacterium]